jgi:DNA modification methylase
MNAPASHTATPADVLAGRARWCVVEGDCADVLRALPDGGVDALVSDPPSGIAFMGAEWDRDKGGRSQWVAWLAGILSDARRATRDGGRAIVWSLPRTSHWTGCAVEDAGWSIETTIAHLFGTGWPKGKAQTKPAQETWWLARTGGARR